MQTLLAIASVITAITVIAVFLKKIYKIVRNIEVNFTEIKSDLASNTLATLRLVVMSSDMPLDERVNAGQEYCSRGGNGSIHAKYDILLEEYKRKIKDGEENER